MLVLIATGELQGTQPDDYSFTVEGELVTPVAAECASGERCGCDRGFPGLASGFATTTAMVAERPGVTEDDLRDAVRLQRRLRLGNAAEGVAVDQPALAEGVAPGRVDMAARWYIGGVTPWYTPLRVWTGGMKASSAATFSCGNLPINKVGWKKPEMPGMTW